MNNMIQVVIDIPKGFYEHIKGHKDIFTYGLINGEKIGEIIASGIVLPKYGRLIDAQEIVKLYAFNKNSNALNGDDDAFLTAIKEVKTILEATTEGE